MSTRHIYENKGVRLYYELPDDLEEIAEILGIYGMDLFAISREHGNLRKGIQSKIESILKVIDITTVNHEGGFSK